MYKRLLEFKIDQIGVVTWSPPLSAWEDEAAFAFAFGNAGYSCRNML